MTIRNKIISSTVVFFILLQPLSARAVEFIKKGDTKEFVQDSYVFSKEEAQKAADNVKELERLKQEIEEYKKLSANQQQQISIQEEKAKLAEQEIELFKKMYADAYKSYEKEKERNDRWYNSKMLWFLLGAGLTAGTIVGGAQLAQ
jgi:hypothetical protein